jgi:hypothetical protein
LPLDFHLTRAEASDSPQFETLLDLDPAVTPRAVIADKDGDAKANREAARARGSAANGRCNRSIDDSIAVRL